MTKPRRKPTPIYFDGSEDDAQMKVSLQKQAKAGDRSLNKHILRILRIYIKEGGQV